MVLNDLQTAVPACFQHSTVEVKRNPSNSPHNLPIIETVSCSAPTPTCLSVKPLKPLTLPWLHLSRRWPLSRRDARTFYFLSPHICFYPHIQHTCIEKHTNGQGKQQLQQHSAPSVWIRTTLLYLPLSLWNKFEHSIGSFKPLNRTCKSLAPSCVLNYPKSKTNPALTATLSFSLVKLIPRLCIGAKLEPVAKLFPTSTEGPSPPCWESWISRMARGRGMSSGRQTAAGGQPVN